METAYRHAFTPPNPQPTPEAQPQPRTSGEGDDIIRDIANSFGFGQNDGQNTQPLIGMPVTGGEITGGHKAMKLDNGDPTIMAVSALMGASVCIASGILWFAKRKRARRRM